MLSIEQYRQLADEIGGERGKQIHELIDEVEDARSASVPEMLAGKQVAELLGIDLKNLHHVRKYKGFPEPTSYAGSRPLWTRASILEYQANKVNRKKGTNGKLP